MSYQEREFWDQIEGMTAAEVFHRVFDAMQAARQAAGITEVPIGVMQALLVNVEELEEARRMLSWMLEGGRMVLCAGVWGDPMANYMVVGPGGRGPLRTTPIAALRAAMETTVPVPTALTPRRTVVPEPGCLCGISVKPCPLHNPEAADAERTTRV